MKCPLLATGNAQHSTNVLPPSPDCFKAECAWWDVGYKRCSMLTLAQMAKLLLDEMSEIAHKMPHAGQFTK